MPGSWPTASPDQVRPTRSALTASPSFSFSALTSTRPIQREHRDGAELIRLSAFVTQSHEPKILALAAAITEFGAQTGFRPCGVASCLFTMLSTYQQLIKVGASFVKVSGGVRPPSVSPFIEYSAVLRDCDVMAVPVGTALAAASNNWAPM